MKKLMIFLMAALVLMGTLLVSCNQNVGEDKLGSVTISQDMARTLSSSAESNLPSADSLTWFYKAVKNDDGFFVTGQTDWTSLTGSTLAGQNLGNFSYGDWLFSFEGRNENDVIYSCYDLPATINSPQTNLTVPLTIGSGAADPTVVFSGLSFKLAAGSLANTTLSGSFRLVVSEGAEEIFTVTTGLTTYDSTNGVSFSLSGLTGYDSTENGVLKTYGAAASHTYGFKVEFQKSGSSTWQTVADRTYSVLIPFGAKITISGEVDSIETTGQAIIDVTETHNYAINSDGSWQCSNGHATHTLEGTESPYITVVVNGQPTEIIPLTANHAVGSTGSITVSENNVTYTGSTNGQEVVIRTNGGTLTINAANDEVAHYGQADYVDIIAVKSSSYDERGTTSLIKVAKGNVALNANSSVGEIHFAKTHDDVNNKDVFTDIKVTLESGAQLPALSRDSLGSTALVEAVLVCEVESSGSSEFYWIEAKGTIEDGEVKVSSTRDGEKTSATSENSTAVAIANAKIGENTFTDKGSDLKPASEMTAEEIASATAEAFVKTFAEIGSKEELIAFRDAWNAGKIAGGQTFKLTASIDISGENWYPIGTWEFPFNGTFDGNGKVIYGLYANSSDPDHVGSYANNSTVGFGETFGFFGIVGGGDTTVQNLSFSSVNINIYNGKDVGAVIGYAPSNSKFKNSTKTKDKLDKDHKDDSMVEIEPYCSSSSFVHKWSDNSVIGTHKIKLSNITVSGNIKATSAVGGIAGKIYSSGKVEVLNCTNNANIEGGSNTSGVVGYIHYSNDITVDGCINTGTVKLTGGAGIVNFNSWVDKTITNNTNTGDIIYNASYSITSSNSYSWDFIAGGVHNSYAYAAYSGNTNTGRFYVQDNENPEATKGVLVVDTNETVTISSVSEYTDVVVNGTLNINADTTVYGCVWVGASGTLNVNAPLSVNGTQGDLNLYNSSLTVGASGSINANIIRVPEGFTIINNGTIEIRVSVPADATDSVKGLKKSNLTVVNNGTFIADSNMHYGENLNFTNNGLYRGNMMLTGSAAVINTAKGRFEAHNGNGIDFRGGSGSFTNYAETPFGSGFDGVSIWAAGTYTVEGANAHLGAGVTNLVLTHDVNTWTASK